MIDFQNVTKSFGARDIFNDASFRVEKGERVGTAEAKKQIAWFIRDINGAASSRFSVMNATGSCDILTQLDALIAQNT